MMKWISFCWILIEVSVFLSKVIFDTTVCSLLYTNFLYRTFEVILLQIITRIISSSSVENDKRKILKYSHGSYLWNFNIKQENYCLSGEKYGILKWIYFKMIGFYNIHTSLYIKWDISHEDEICLQSNISRSF